MARYCFVVVLFATGLYAQQRTYTKNDILHIADSLIYRYYHEHRCDTLLKISEENSYLSYPYKTHRYAYPRLMSPGQFDTATSIEYKKIPFSDLQQHVTPFNLVLSYRSRLPEHPDAVCEGQMSLYIDTAIKADLYSMQGIVPKVIRWGKPYVMTDIRTGLHQVLPVAYKILKQYFSAQALKQCVQIDYEVASVTRVVPDGGYFITPAKDTFVVVDRYAFQFNVFPSDFPEARQWIRLELDDKLHLIDSASLRRFVDQFPSYVFDATPSHILTKKNALDRVLELGLPEGKEDVKYFYSIYLRQDKRYVWDIFSIQRYLQNAGGFGPCTTWHGPRMVIDAITGQLVERLENQQRMEGCWD